MTTYEAVTIPPTGKHTSTIIFFHGLGESGSIWAELLTNLRKPNTKIICPSAPKIPLTLNKGFAIPAWFDLSTLNEDAPENESDILRAVDNVHAILDEELAKTRLPPKKLLLGGFSQGGALALYAALTYHRPLAGVLILSCWIPLHKTFPDAATNNTNIPIFQCHGTEDPVIPYVWGTRTSEILKEFATKSQFTSYEGLLHRTNEKELADIKSFIHKTVT
ncbi:acyl-protein thioesterase 2-like [Metopolophium dirhodum]|uniref:acyl-protein thioesterase 2-like n=1 Tax=Metopolophium dirhodum TaxID=44670 RepID=UPI002990065B|nr:acyl-protein thioesterase 2-like [Metopolophium dirhodum]